ncbi:HEAT repeat domain-containing protein [Streptomyces cyaneofuscatus]|uniref:HEAT repeat domain-containing protein n=1 Tax=Streptomyces cyaneofuscatus TaxID=66883 RepID=A0ABZ1EQ10_9ACTN|nr:HEAT repeat domain-containing protein [Streptomyces cyaneofuscatus]WSB06163.1 HEAT repeat domain-containing protein [Streptomyces cyaneofuscatus]WSD50302.1 HEAT repeat domain-containing protein [Streptomyces cyaneofuscatus]
MTTPPQEPIEAALARADAGLLARHLDARTCAPELLGRLVRHPDPRVRHLGLALLTERTSAPTAAGSVFGSLSGSVSGSVIGSGFGQQELLVGLLPDSSGATPEESLALAELHGRLRPEPDRPRRALPDWRAAGWPARVRIAWLRAELLADPAVVSTEPAGELLYQAVRATDVLDAHHPERLVAQLAATKDPVLQDEALRLARAGLHAGLLAPAVVRGLLVRLLGAPDTGVVKAALRELAEPWAVVVPLDASVVGAPLSGGGYGDSSSESAALAGDSLTEALLAEAALTTAARHGHHDLLLRTAGDEAADPALRRRAVELLGGLAERTGIGRLLALAARDPLLFAGPVLTCLGGLHRRGHFPSAPDVVPVLGLALADHTQPAEDVATILHTCRRPFFDALLDAPLTASDWPRRLDLLVALAGQGAPGIPVGEAVARLLPTAPAPGPFLGAIRILRPAGAEEAVLALLPTAPVEALAALEAIGGDRTEAALALGLGVGEYGSDVARYAPWAAEGEPGAAPTAAAAVPGAGIAPALRAVRGRALELLWHLTTDHDRRRRLLARLDPTDLPPRIAADLGAPDERELAVLRSRPDEADPVAALRRITEHAGAGTSPLVADLLLRVVRDLAAPREPAPAPDRRHRPREDGPRPDGEPELPDAVLDAVQALGRRLYARRRIRPVCLLDAPDAPGAGHALLATTLLDLLDRPGTTGAEQAVLLKALLRIPATAHTRPRVHRLLRSRDPQVRKHVIALLAHDTSGTDARALSATLLPLTASPDIRTVRQALLALGAARADWAAEPVAACLGHPNMNIRKTAAGTLAHAGGPEAVPHLLRRLGRDDNPGLRDALTRALRTVLGEAYAATLVAAAEESRDERARRLLLAGLDGIPSARSVLALHTQGSPVAPALLVLVADGRVRLSSGSVQELAEPLAGLGLPVTPHTPARWPDVADREVAALLRGGWDPALALRIARRPEPPDPAQGRQIPVLRAQLDRWLALADSSGPAALRARLLWCALRLCPAPWSADEVAVLGRYAGVVTEAFEEAVSGGGPEELAGELLDVLDAVVPALSAVRRFTVVEQLRVLRRVFPASPALTLSLLRRCGAVLVRADVDRALAAAHLGPDPWRTAPAVLREAFGVPDGEAADVLAGGGRGAPAGAADVCTDGHGAQRQAVLREAVRTPGTLAEFRRGGVDGAFKDAPGALRSRRLLHALMDAYPAAGPDVRAPLLDWMTVLQPPGAPPWTAAEPRSAPTPPAQNGIRQDDQDGPHSAARQTRLLALLEADDPEDRNAAARALGGRPEPEVVLVVVRAYLRGRVDQLPGAGVDRLARTPAGLGVAELGAEGVEPERALRCAERLRPWDLPPLVPMLLDRWQHGPPAVHAAARTVLDRVPADVLAHLLGPRVEADGHGLLELLAGRPLLRTPELDRVRRRLRDEGRDALADRLVLVAGPLRGPDAEAEDAAALDALRAPAEDVPAARAHRPALAELLDLARGGTPEQIRRALGRLVEEYTPTPGGEPDPTLHAVIEELLRHPRAGVRLHAHRASRALFDRAGHARSTVILLSDPLPDVVRMAVRTLDRASWEPALPELVRLLQHPKPVVRSAAREAVTGFGPAAAPVLRRAAAHARPDRRSLYTDLLAQVAETGRST